MGRYSTVPEVEDLGLNGWVITRVLDPDDEFSVKQLLGEEGWFDFEDCDSYEAFMWLSIYDADAALKVYLCGAADGLDCAVRAANAAGFH